MNTKDILKIAGVKDEASLYKKYPTHEAFLAKHGKEIKKAQLGTAMKKAAVGDTLSPNIIQNMYGIGDPSTMKSLNYNMDQNMPGMPSQLGYNLSGDPNKQQYNLQGNALQEQSSQQAVSGLPFHNPSSFNSGQGNKQLVNSIGKYAPAAGQLVQGFSELNAEKNQRKSALQMKDVSDLALQASRTQPEILQNKYVRPEDIENTGDKFFPVYGAGTNVLGKNGLQLTNRTPGPGEIQNTYAPNTLYNDLGYEPLNDTDRIKAFANGGMQAGNGFLSNMRSVADAGGADQAQQLITGIGGQNAGGDIGGTIGRQAGQLIGGPPGGMVGQVAGQIGGALLDRNPHRIKQYQNATMNNINDMAFNHGAQGIHGQYASYMEDGGNLPVYEEGGWINPNYNPQVITKFGDTDVSDIHNIVTQGMNTLRTGGHIRQNYTYPEDKFAMGGELQVYKGDAEPISQNPYLPGDGETVMFRGPSHADGGMPITYGNNPVEVEGGEPAVKLQDGGSGEDNLVVFGNLPIHNSYLPLLGDENAKGKKFKNYVADLSKQEERHNSVLDKSTTALNDLKVNTPLDQLKFNSLKAGIQGSLGKLKDIAEKKQNAAALQQAINDTADERGLEADALAKGNIKQAKKGANISKALNGKNTNPFLFSQSSWAPDSAITPPTDSSIDPLQQLQQRINYGYNIADQNQPNQIALNTQSPSSSSAPKKNNISDVVSNYYNEVLPFVRPSNREALDPNQLMGEMYALSSNQLQPVKAQTFTPQLTSPYDISLNDQLSSIDAQSRAAIKASGQNPAAQAQIMAQANNQKNQVLGEQMRINQQNKAQTYNQNINTQNQAQLQNLGILDQQYTRQQQAITNTKDVNQAAINSIADKYAKNKLENRTLQTYENLYNYRYDPNMRALNMNPLTRFNTQMGNANPNAQQRNTITGPNGETFYAQYKNGKLTGYLPAGNATTDTPVNSPISKTKSRNGSIVKELKNI